MFVNDHVLKPWLGGGPLGLITGKISDFTAPLIGSVLIALVLSAPALRRIPLDVRNRVALVVPALTLVAIKLSATGASWYEHILATVTGTSHRIVVDPTDIIGLAVLPLTWRVLNNPNPISLPISLPISVPRRRLSLGQRRWAVTVLGGAAMLLTVANSVSEYEQRSEITERDGVLFAHSPTGSTARVSTDGGDSWEWHWNVPEVTQPLNLAVDERITKLCLRNNPTTCVRITDPITVEESLDGGATWWVVWQLDDELDANLSSDSHGHQEHSGPIELTDIHETANGTVLIAAGNLDPVRRSPTGEWRPTVTDLRLMPTGLLILVAVAVGIGAILVSLLRVNPKWAATLVGGVIVISFALPILSGVIDSAVAIPEQLLAPIFWIGGLVRVLWLPAALGLVLASGRRGRRLLARNLVAALVVVALMFTVWLIWANVAFASEQVAWIASGFAILLGLVVMLLPERFFPEALRGETQTVPGPPPPG